MTAASSDPQQVGAQFAELTRPGHCDKHGDFVRRNIIRGIWSSCPACAVERSDQELAAAQAAEVQRMRRVDAERMGAAAIPARFVGKTFDGYRCESDTQRRAVTICRDFAEQFHDHLRRGAGLVLAGSPGTGKSHLVAAILQSVMPRPVRYATAMDLIRAVRGTWRRDSEQSEEALLKYLTGIDLLAIDEVGAQYGTDGEATILFDVLDRRYREVKPTILMTNQDADGLKSYVGERAYDRLTETSRWVQFNWPSYRPQAKREAQ